MNTLKDALSLDATAQAELIRNKEIKPLELVEAAIAEIERLNPQINAVVTPIFEQGREAAAGNLPEEPFTGVPFLLKDILASYAGVTMTLGQAQAAGFSVVCLLMFVDRLPISDMSCFHKFRI